MNPTHDLRKPPRLPAARPFSGAAATLVALAAAIPVHADIVQLNSPDGFGASSFNSAGGWSNGAMPSAGNDYVVSIERIRTPVAAGDYAFAGDSLTLSTAAGKLSFKVDGSSTITVPDLILDGGIVDHINASTQVFTLAGNITVTGTGSRISATQGPINVTAPISGTGDLTILNNLVTTFSGANTFTGSLTVSGAFVLAGSGSLSFTIGASGVNNSVTGTAPATFDGTFNLDLTAAGNTVGDQWILVDAATLGETFGATFNVAGFTENNGFWTSADGRYQFNEATGILTRISGDSDGDGLPDTWETANFGNLDWGALDDPDGDYATNLLEYQSVTDPDDDSSWPDTDDDTLNDGWELAFFANSLAQGPDDDPDADHNSNLAEYEAGTDPMTAFSYPDSDGDGMNDGWELFHFPEAANVTAVDPEADPDGDLSGNLDEFLAFTDPNDQLSSPDSDFDGLPDGWEVKYFRVGSETLAEVTERYNETGDPDGDGISNKLEFVAGTDPTDAQSAEITLGYWRFEEAIAGEVPAGGNGQYLFPTSIQDSSAYGNHMMAWADYSRPNYDAVVPAATVPATGAADTGSLYFLRNGNGRYFIESVFTTPTNYLGGGEAILRTHSFSQFTVEASFNPGVTGQWQVPVCKMGNPVAGQPPFSIKIDTTNKVRAGLVDGSGVAREIIGTTTVAAGSWYSAAVTGTATEMKLWLKKPGDAGYVLEGTLAISGAWYVPGTGPLDTVWNIGGGVWNDIPTDAFQGHIDEVRISAVALPETAFLFHQDATPFQLWAEQNIPDVNQRGESADPDGDGTSNLAEFRLGLDPMNGSSFFAGTLSGSTLSWPAAAGIEFTVQRSTTLGDWDDVATVTATGAAASWTDLTPPEGKAFYRVVFTE